MDIKEEFLKHGIVIIPNVFTEDECLEIKKQAYSVTDEQIVRGGYPHGPSETAYDKKSLIFFPALANEYLNKIRTDQRLSNIVKSIIGNNVRQINNQVYFRERNDIDQFAWHRDTIFREDHLFKKSVSTDYLQTIIAVDDITENNGVVEFIPGSHKWENFPKPKNLRIFERNDLYGIKYTMNKGSVAVWSVMIVHGSESNFSNSDRMTYMNGFCKTESVSSYPHYLIDGKIEKTLNSKMIP